MDKIDSPKNTRIIQYKKLAQPKYQKKTGQYLLEGRHLVKDAIKSGQAIILILATAEQLAADFLKDSKLPMIEISEAVAKTLSQTMTDQGVFAILKRPDLQLPSISTGSWLILDQVQDPGNIGTMIRTADAAGFSGVILGEGSGDVFQPKILRSMQGSHFHLPIYQGDLLTVIPALIMNKMPVYGSALDPLAVNYEDVQAMTNFALIMGNEGNGMQAKHLTLTTHNLYIPIKGQAESLNVAVAAGILMFKLKK